MSGMNAWHSGLTTNMNDYVASDYTFDALCLKNKSPVIDTLAYVIGLVDSEKHGAGDPGTGRHKILYPLSEGEGQVSSPKELLRMQAEFLPPNYLPQTPVMFVRRWSPITSILHLGFEPVTLSRKADGAPFAIASGIWKPGVVSNAKSMGDSTTDEELFWAVMNEVFNRAHKLNWLVNVLAEVGWSYKNQVGTLQKWNDKEIAKSGRVIWKRTVDG